MSQKLISLKPMCRNRHSSQIQPSFSSRAFFLDDFSSPDFLEFVVFPHYDNDPESTAAQKPSSLSKIISQVSEAFDAVRAQISSLESQFMQHLSNFLTDSDKSGELNVIRNTLKKCHNRILQSDCDSKLIDEFAELLDTYDRTIKKNSDDFYAPEKVGNVSQKLDQIKKKLDESIQDCLKLASSSWPLTLARKPAQTESDLSDEIRQVLGLKKKDKEIKDQGKMSDQDEYEDEDEEDDDKENEEEEMSDEEEEISDQGVVVRQNNRDYYLSLMNSENRLKMFDLKQKSLAYSKLDLKNLDTQYFYAESLNIIIATHPQPRSESALTIYQVGSRNLKKIARIKMNPIPLNVSKHSILQFQVMNPQHIVAIVSSYSIALLNIFTRRMIKEYYYQEEIISANYIKQEGLFMIVMHSKILVYDVLDQCLLSTIMTESEIHQKNSRSIEVRSNIVLYYEYKENFDRHSYGYIQDDYSVYTFCLLKVTRQGVKKCQTLLKVRDLVDEDYYMEERYKSSSFSLNKYIHRPELQEIIVFYSINGDLKKTKLNYSFNDQDSFRNEIALLRWRDQYESRR